MLKYKIIDNFLPYDYFIHLRYLISHRRLDWYYKDYGAYEGGKDGPSLVHVLYHDEPTSKLMPEFTPLLHKLEVKKLLQLRANMLLRDHNYPESDFHVDFDNIECMTGILYFNTNNGYTLLGEKEKIKVESVENRLLFFPVNVKHAAVRQTDTSRRIVLNINYI